MQQVTITLTRFNPRYKINIQRHTLRSVGFHCMRREATPWSIHSSAQRLKKPKQEPKNSKQKKKNHSSSCSAQATVQWWFWKGAKHTKVLWREKAQGPEAPIPLPTSFPLAANNQSLSQSAMNHMAHRRQVWEHEWWANSALFDTYVAECLVAVYSHVPDMHSYKEGPSNSHHRDSGSWGIWD